MGGICGAIAKVKTSENITFSLIGNNLEPKTGTALTIADILNNGQIITPSCDINSEPEKIIVNYTQPIA